MPNLPTPLKGNLSTSWTIGQTVEDTYKIIDKLGDGAMGEVHRVHHLHWQIDLAVKSLKPELRATENQIADVKREAETWVGLGLHPNIVTCYYVRTLYGQPRIFNEVVDGGSLADCKIASYSEMLDIAIQTAWGLGYAHSKGVVHQDFKPRNVLMTADRCAKVNDFGFAKVLRSAEEAPPEFVGTVTPSVLSQFYCSPEQLDGKPLTTHTDMWSWALSLLQMFAGEVVWRSGALAGEIPLESITRIDKQGHAQPMPDMLAALLRQCFEEACSRRPKNMESVADELIGMYQAETGKAYPRRKPRKEELLADSLNNHALSYWDLGRRDEARAAFAQALAIEPQHPEAIFNQSIVDWRDARIADDTVIQNLEAAVQVHPQAKYYLAQAHLERWAPDEATLVIESAAGSAGADANPLAEHVLEMADAAMRQPLHAQGGPPAALAGALAEEFTPTPWYRKLRDLPGHVDHVGALALSSRGDRMASGSGSEQNEIEQSLRVWDPQTGEQLHNLAVEEPVSALTFTLDGQFLVSGSGKRMGASDCRLRLWDLHLGTCAHVFEGHHFGVTGIAVLPDGERMVSVGWDGALRVWDLTTGKCTYNINTGQWMNDRHIPIMAIAIAPDGRSVFAGCLDGTVRVFSIDQEAWGDIIQAHDKWVGALAITPDGKRLMTGDLAPQIRVWDFEMGKLVKVMALDGHASGVSGIVASPCGKQCVSASYDGTVRVWELHSGRCLRTLSGFKAQPLSIAIASSGAQVIVGTTYGSVQQWEVNPMGCGPEAALQISRCQGYESLAQRRADFLRPLKRAADAWRAGRAVETSQYLQQARSIAGFSCDPSALELNAELAKLFTRGALRGAWPLQVLSGHESDVNAVAISADGRLGVSGSGREGVQQDDRSVRLWDLSLGQGRLVLDGHEGPVVHLCFEADEKLLLSWGDGDRAYVWDLKKGSSIQRFEGYDRGEVHWRRTTVDTWDQKRVIACSVLYEDPYSNEVFLLGKSTDQAPKILGAHKESISVIRCIDDGRHFISASQDATLKIWDIEAGVDTRTIAIGSSVRDVVVTMDGRFAISACSDNTIRISDLHTGQAVLVLEGHDDVVTALALSENGRYLLSGSRDRTVRLWELDWEYTVREPVDWDESIRPYLKVFLNRHPPVRRGLVRRRWVPNWTTADLQRLLDDLARRGLGWVRVEGVRQKLETMAVQGPSD